MGQEDGKVGGRLEISIYSNNFNDEFSLSVLALVVFMNLTSFDD